MALTTLQRHVCRLLADARRQAGESYVAGGAALNELLGGTRTSRDVDLFHDTEKAVATTWAADRAALAASGLTVIPLRERPAFVEARVTDGTDAVVLEWTRDSAYRFLPLQEHEVFGLTLHPLDLATNKVLALVGRREVRDWVDALRCHDAVQPLGYLAWAGAGKDPGFSPLAIVEEAARTRYAQEELDRLAFDGATPGAADLSGRWHRAIDEARALIRALPPERTGECVLGTDGRPYRGSAEALAADLEGGRVVFHAGRIRGAFPELRTSGK
jgi:hypothetical protein